MQLSIEPNDRVRFAIRYEDEHVIVADKPAGLVTQPGKGHDHDALLNGLFAKHGPKLQNLGAKRDFGLLHRLDKPTSGLVIAALTSQAYDGLRAQFESREIDKFYYAITRDTPKRPTGVINKPIVEDVGDKKLAKISSSGKPAATVYRVLATNAKGCLLECKLVTGRLHQVRVHLAAIGCEILGDGEYAPMTLVRMAPRLALHAHLLRFTHPITGEKVTVKSPMPKELKRVLTKLGLEMPTKAATQAIKKDEIHRSEAEGDENDGTA